MTKNKIVSIYTCAKRKFKTNKVATINWKSPINESIAFFSQASKQVKYLSRGCTREEPRKETLNVFVEKKEISRWLILGSDIEVWKPSHQLTMNRLKHFVSLGLIFVWIFASSFHVSTGLSLVGNRGECQCSQKCIAF